MSHQGNVFRFRRPGRAECGEISAGIWGFIHLLWLQSKHSLWFGGSSLNRMWEAFLFGVFPFVCVSEKERKQAFKHVWQYVCTQISICVCVFSLTFEPERRKCFQRDSPQPVNLRWVGPAKQKKKKEREKNDVRYVSWRQHVSLFQPKWWKMQLEMCERPKCQPLTE